MHKIENLWKRYLLALSLIAIFVTIVFSISEIEAAKTVEYSSLVNISGRQRMLSQRIALYSSEYLQTITAGQKNQNQRAELIAIRDLFESSHSLLLEGDIELNLSDLANDVAYDIYFAAPYNLDQRVQEYLSLVDIILGNENFQKKNEALARINELSREIILMPLDMVVKRIEEHDVQETEKLILIERLSYLMAILIIILEALFIFLPAHRFIIRSQKELIDTNKELEEFAYRTSHDLRSPLVSVIGLSQIAKKAVIDKKQAIALESLDHIEASSQKLEILVKDILTLTKIKHIDEPKVKIDFDQLIDETLDKFSLMDNFKRLEIQKSLKFLNPIYCKKTRITLIIENLISNCIKYQDLSEKLSFIAISTYEEDKNFIFKIEDNGLGIPSKQKDKMFKMFHRFHNKVSFGSGLGLYMMKKSAEILGGNLVYEEPEKGTIFKLILPSHI